LTKLVLASSTGHRRRYCPKGFRPPYIVRRSYKWTYLSMRRSSLQQERAFCLYLPRMDARCLQRASLSSFPKPTATTICSRRARRRSEPSLRRDHLPRECRVPAPSCLLSRARPGREVVSRIQARVLSNQAFETVGLLQEALGHALRPYWEEPARLRGLTGYSWWVEAVNAL
jgi:hypothetical protein